MRIEQIIENILRSRKKMAGELKISGIPMSTEEEGGCGVVGFCCTEPIPGKHIHEPSRLMHNRGNGKGGGIAAVGFIPEQLGISREVLDDYYMLHIAYLDPACRSDVEKQYIVPSFDIENSARLQTAEDWTKIKGLQVKPPDVYRYFVRVKRNVLDKFISENSLDAMDRREAEDEYVNQNSFRLNHDFYVSESRQSAFVMSQGRNIMILKVVGYAEAITEYYRINDLKAHVWIAHQRYPTRGRVWHPGGAHPFTAMNMALVHNGDFANYHSVTEYLMQRNIYPQFVTDTEVSALLFDLLTRTYHYPLEYTIEALAPTTELDFDNLPAEKQKTYRAIQATHIHGSPDGPWFFIIARNMIMNGKLQLLGITDTAMLRPQVFAFADGEVQVGLICSEKQAIDAALKSLAKDDPRICPVADRYWNARGGSHSDGGAFVFDLIQGDGGTYRMECKDKFGIPVPVTNKTEACEFSADIASFNIPEKTGKEIAVIVESGDSKRLYSYFADNIHAWTFDELRLACLKLRTLAKDNSFKPQIIEALTLLNDLHYHTGNKRRSHILYIVRMELNNIFGEISSITAKDNADALYRLINFASLHGLRAPENKEKTLVIDAGDFPAEGENCDAACVVKAYKMGWRNFIVFKCAGQRFAGCGLGPDTRDVTIDIYGSPGDYLGSGLDGLTITVHNNAQDQLGQIIKSGKMVIHGDAGQTFLYGAKGGEVYVAGNAAGRPLINSVGKPRVVINGTCLDFLGESFMAGDYINGGGFVIVNAIRLNDEAEIVPLPEPYPGSNLFSLASGGAAFIRDPKNQLVEEQLNGCMFSPLTDKDWELILPYLEENERLFDIKVSALLTLDGVRREPSKIYRKVVPVTEGPEAAEAEDIFAEKEIEEIQHEI